MMRVHISDVKASPMRMRKRGWVPLPVVMLVMAVLLFVPLPVQGSSNPSVPGAISIIAPPDVLERPLTRIAIEDVQQLLKKGFPRTLVSLNDPDAGVQIVLPAIDANGRRGPSRFTGQRPYHYLAYPDHGYEWRSRRRGDKTVLLLNSQTYEGISFGLYGLLQERLGFKFYHPRRTLIPSHKQWPLPAVFGWKAVPRFDKKGFHIHTEHPIELTEQLHNPDYPGALADLKEYADWLVRNQQNVMQFYLLRGIDRERWIRHAGEFVDYAHRRGLLIGVEFSLSSLQQQAFQTIKLLRFLPSHRQQIDETLSWLFRVKWDFVTVDFTMGEYLPDLGRVFPSLKEYMVKEITERYDTKLFFATHVIPRGEKEAGGIRAGIGVGGTPLDRGAASRKTGILLHSVMCYSVTESRAPVYGNLNLRGVLERAIDEGSKQETWYWPESAYWVSFDNSVPLLLLLYLDSRLSDMATMEKAGIVNHLTFSSGWEWGYWLIDWSIARWAWRHIRDGKEAVTEPLAMVHDLFPDGRLYRLWREALALQNRYLKKENLLPFLAALDPSAELPWPFNKPFQPRPPFSYRWLLKGASDAEAMAVLEGLVALLEEYAEKMNAVVGEMRQLSTGNHSAPRGVSQGADFLLDELIRGVEMTALRARHRALTIRALIAKRKAANDELTQDLLGEAGSIREQALSLVQAQERSYRYPLELIARRRSGFTAYNFGYLYPAGNLFFWYREEQQVKNERFDGLYMNIWDFGRLLSIKGLL
ncbi:MAG TPA: hypothetical protein VFG09_11070 [Thermodesulfovibrionales bacterium]|jgi:hypothetical protein|nr:hypothetical protein [Thermodesulfovibrionales bacterium]